jgi:hypothetical protein
LATIPSYKCIKDFSIGLFQNKNDKVMLVNNNNAKIVSSIGFLLLHIKIIIGNNKNKVVIDK